MPERIEIKRILAKKALCQTRLVSIRLSASSEPTQPALSFH